MIRLLPFRFIVAALALSALAIAAAAVPTARAAQYVPGEVVVGYTHQAGSAVASGGVHGIGARAAPRAVPGPNAHVLRLPPGLGVAAAVQRLRHEPGIAYAVPNFVAHADAAGWFPDDPGAAHGPAGWTALQWNFVGPAGVNAPWAWANLLRDRRPGGSGVTIAVLDSGVAYRDWRGFRRSPDFDRTRFVAPYDFVAHNRFPLDREGHGTFVAGTIAESTNNGIGLAGLAYGASIMPIRVLAPDGTGDAATIARGIRYAAAHHAQVINLSLEFTSDVTAGDIPNILNAIRYAISRRVVVVGASGNEGVAQVAYPARAPSVISVGATTRDLCLANYSNGGSGLDLVAPGGGLDSSLVSDPSCHPGRRLPPIYQMTFATSGVPTRFGLRNGIYGTSMATPHVSATAALVIASGVLGRHPAPEQIRARLEQTATPLGRVARPNPDYGWGLVNAGAATASGSALASSRR